MEEFISTRCARIKKSAPENFVAVEYIAHKKKKITENPKTSETTLHRKDDRDNNIDPRKQQELEMKRARYDVIKFGMSGFGNVEFKKAKVAAAVALGARPPNNKKIPYKKLKEERSKAKEKIKKQERVSGANKSLVKLQGRKKKQNNNNRKKDSGILGVYGKVERSTSRSKNTFAQ